MRTTLISLLCLHFCVLQGCMILSRPTAPVVNESNASDIYFPPHTFPSDTSFRYVRSHSLSAVLDEMKEPSLYKQGKAGVEAYRLLFQPAFEPWLAIRVFRLDEDVFIVSKMYSTKKTGNPNDLREVKAEQLKIEKWKKLQRLLEEVNFWSIATEHDNCCFDGVTCTFEGTRDGQYHIIDWPNPRDQSYWRLCDFMLNIGK